jgi:hypothetical protein
MKRSLSKFLWYLISFDFFIAWTFDTVNNQKSVPLYIQRLITSLLNGLARLFGIYMIKIKIEYFANVNLSPYWNIISLLVNFKLRHSITADFITKYFLNNLFSTYWTNYTETISQHLTSNIHKIEGHKKWLKNFIDGCILLFSSFYSFAFYTTFLSPHGAKYYKRLKPIFKLT